MRCAAFLPAVALLSLDVASFTPAVTLNHAATKLKAIISAETKQQTGLGEEFEQGMLRSKAALDDLMQTKEFRSSLESESAPSSPPSPSANTPHQDDHSVRHFEFSMLQERAALNGLMQTKGFRSALDSEVILRSADVNPHPHSVLLGEEEDHGVHHFEFAMLSEKTALDGIMHRSSFRHALDSEDAISAARKSMTSTRKDSVSHMWFSTLKQKRALDKLMRTTPY